eukprot:7598302-Alexandrium_andersonii.AAC.1
MRESEVGNLGVKREKAGKCKFEVVKGVHVWMQRKQENGNAKQSVLVIMHLLDMVIKQESMKAK